MKLYNVTNFIFDAKKPIDIDSLHTVDIVEVEADLSLPSEGRLGSIVDKETRESFDGTLFVTRELAVRELKTALNNCFAQQERLLSGVERVKKLIGE